MKKTFTTTHIVLIGTNLDSIVKFSDFKSVDDFKNYLNENELRYDMEDGVFVSDNYDIAPAIFICEKEYYDKEGYLADWDHCGLSDYLNNRESGITWSEESESVWSAYGSSLYTESENVEKIFNDLKAIDGVEIEIELDDDYEFGYEEKSTPTPPTPSCDKEPKAKKTYEQCGTGITKALFDNYYKAADVLKSANYGVEFAISDIVKVMQGEQGYVEFTDETLFPIFHDDCVGDTDSIVAARWNEEEGELQFITDSQHVNPDDATDNDWFYWKDYGTFDFYNFIHILESMLK